MIVEFVTIFAYVEVSTGAIDYGFQYSSTYDGILN